MLDLIDNDCVHCGYKITEKNPGVVNSSQEWCCVDCHDIHYPDWYLSDSITWPGKEEEDDASSD